ncbi:lysylphosphatidylglycerol synthase transmembrane domain-containing protein [Candidatus Cardinium hertigii]|uniref:Flippase-like domain-containing protein n=1 Tax=Candidatus Cardinium hertigii TaxID=247481 RepID=A0A2Z3LH41_9BACT|nr:lysylphosphatidylglycerol synthase transmembrane domain-containing protein [Candidatus Cardinium hertigii]AWN81825.1 hypothetical protein DK880_00504 [Candidatus Cardinium hertigii]
METQENNNLEALKVLNLRRIWFPTLCGLAILGFWFYRAGNKLTLATIAQLGRPNGYYLSMAFSSILLREIGHICRLRFLSNATLSWTSCFYIAILWEFSSALTPSVVGGGIVAIFLFSKEGLPLGRSLAYVIVNGIMDNFFFLLAGMPAFGGMYKPLFAMADEFDTVVKSIFFINYFILCIYTLVITMGVFINPTLLKYILLRITSIGFLKKWRRSAYHISKDIVITSHEFKGKGFFFWCKILSCTFFTWMARYSFLNCLIAAYTKVSLSQHVAMFGKQVIMWALMLIPFLPGGSGIAEYSFIQFFEPILGDYTPLIALLWRACTFFLYLLLGIIFLPRWIHRVLEKNA